jgi:putative hydrolase of HD superfamily
MKQFLDFFIEAGKLKTRERKGIAFYGVKNPETTAEHTFRMAIVGWFLGVNERLNMEEVFKIILTHDLCEVYAGDITPYDGLLPKNAKARYAFVRRWPRLSEKQKKTRYLAKFKKEEKSLRRLVKYLPLKEGKQIMDYWLDYEKGHLKDGKFVHQIDRTENLIEAFNCWQRDKNFPTKPWWEHAEQVIDNPNILKFVKIIEAKELHQKHAKDDLNENLLAFFSEVEKLKGMKRQGWVINGIKNPESAAQHNFRASLMTWVLAQKKRGLDMEKILKISFIHELGKIYAGDITPYDTMLSERPAKNKEVLKNWPKLPESKWNQLAKARFKKEEKGFNKIVSKLPARLKNEAVKIWLEYKKGTSPEAKFFRQVDGLENFLQAMEYNKKYNKPSKESWADWADEFFKDPMIIEMAGEIKKKFHIKQK